MHKYDVPLITKSMKHSKPPVSLPKLCKQILPVSSGTKITPGETMVLEAGTLRGIAFPDLMVVAGCFEIDEISLEVNRAGKRIILLSLSRGDRADLDTVSELFRRLVLPSGSYMRLVVRNVGNAPRIFAGILLFYLSVVEERERLLDELDRHARTDAWLDEIRKLEQGAQGMINYAEHLCTEHTDNTHVTEFRSWHSNQLRKTATENLHKAKELRLRGRGAVPSWWTDDHQRVVDLSEAEARQLDAALARCDDELPRHMIGAPATPGLAIDAFNGPICFRGLDNTFIPVTCDGPSRVLPGKSAWFIAQPERTFHPSRLVISCCSQDWAIEDLHANGKSIFTQVSIIPANAFHSEALDCSTVVPAGGSFAIKAHYIGSNPRGGRFRTIVHGHLIP